MNQEDIALVDLWLKSFKFVMGNGYRVSESLTNETTYKLTRGKIPHINLSLTLLFYQIKL